MNDAAANASRADEARALSRAPDGELQDGIERTLASLARRPLARVALCVLALFYASAIYAPLLANDRPYVLDAVDFRAYENARSALAPIAASIAALAEATTRGEAMAARSLEGERIALSVRLERMASALGEADRAGLARVGTLADETCAAARQRDLARTSALATELASTARTTGEEYVARDPARGAATGRELVSRTSHPLFEALGAAEVFFMVLWAFVLAFPLWNPLVNRIALGGERARIRRARTRKLAVALAVSLAAALAWGASVHGPATIELTDVKQGLSRGEIVARRVIFPPLSLGFAETRFSESFRPPTWRAEAEISDDGRYVRAPLRDAAALAPAADPVEVRYGEPARNSPWRHVFGTDALGRDVLVRLLWGGRISLSVGLVAAAILAAIGLAVGATAGYLGGRVDFAISRAIEVVQSFPAFFLILTAVALVPARSVHPMLTIVIAISAVGWTGIARLVRGEILRLKTLGFVDAARALGFSRSRIVLRHLIPNALGPVLVAGAFAVAAGILIESAVSFLGFGVQHPIPSWGSLINESRQSEHWWIQLFPGLAIFATVLATNVLGDAVRDALDPRSQT